MFSIGVEYYDISLYSYMAPVLIPVFFPPIEQNTAYFLYFFVEFCAAFFQFLGATTLGFIGDKYGRKPALYSSILGASCITFFICLIPSYSQIGILASYLFVFMRLLQRFFFGAEFNGGAIYCLEQESNKNKHGTISGLYSGIGALGIMLANVMSMYCLFLGNEYFRLAYGISFILALISFKLRSSIIETPEYLANIKINRKKDTFNINVLFKSFIVLIILMGFCIGVVNGLTTKIFNVLLPISLPITNLQMSFINLLTLSLFAVALVYAGFLSDRYSPRTIIILGLILCTLLSYPLFMLLESSNWILILMIKVIFTIISALIIAPCHTLAQNLSVVDTRYRSISKSYTIGKTLSTLLLSLTFLIYKYFDNIQILGVILSAVSLILMIKMYRHNHIHIKDKY